MSPYAAQSLLPYLASTLFLAASRRLFRTSQTATHCTSVSPSITAQIIGTAAAESDAAHHDAFAGGDGSARPSAEAGMK